MDNFQDLYGCCGRREKTGENGGRGNGTETEKILITTADTKQ